MKTWDIQIMANKHGESGLDELRRIAKKAGYRIVEENENEIVYGITIEKIKAGHPRKNINKDEIIALREKGNSMSVIAKTLGVTRSTLYRYLLK